MNKDPDTAQVWYSDVLKGHLMSGGISAIPDSHIVWAV